MLEVDIAISVIGLLVWGCAAAAETFQGSLSGSGALVHPRRSPTTTPFILSRCSNVAFECGECCTTNTSGVDLHVEPAGVTRLPADATVGQRCMTA